MRRSTSWPGERRQSTAAVVAAAAVAHGVVVLAIWHGRASVERPELVVETILLASRPPPVRTRTPAPASRQPAPALTPRPVAPLVAPTPVENPSPLAPLAVAPQPPASAASAPPRLPLALTPRQLHELEATRPRSLAESTLHPPHASPFDGLAGIGDGVEEIRRPDGSIESHVHGTCYVQVQGLAQRLDPIGHAHDAPQVKDCKD